MAATTSSISSCVPSSYPIPSSEDHFHLALDLLKNETDSDLKRSGLELIALWINQRSSPKKWILQLLKLLLDHSLLGCTEPWQALIRIEPLIENKQALADAAGAFYLPDREPASSMQAQGALWFASYSGNRALAVEALLRGADLNAPLYPQMTALLLACKRGHDPLALLLIERGAHVQFIGGSHHHQTPLSEARLKKERMRLSLPRLEWLDRGFTDEFLSRKHLAHDLSLTVIDSTISGVRLFLDGFRTRYALAHFLRQSQPFYTQIKRELSAGRGILYRQLSAPLRARLQSQPDLRLKLISAINTMLETVEDSLATEVAGWHSDPNKMYAHALKRLEQGKPVLCFGVTRLKEDWKTGAPNSHAWGLVIFKKKTEDKEEYLAQLCNRGYGSGERSGILMRTFTDPELKKLLRTYYDATNWKEDYFNVPDQALNDIHLQFSTEDTVHLPQTAQLIGNCCHYSTRCCVRALLRAPFQTILDSKETLSKDLLTLSTRYTRPIGLRSYLIRHYGESDYLVYQPDEFLLKRIHARLQQSPKWRETTKLFSKAVQSRLASIDEPTQRNYDLFLGPDSRQTINSREDAIAFLNNPSLTELHSRVSRLTLSNYGLQTIPWHSFNHLQILHLAKNRLSELPIPFLPTLEVIDLSHNRLRSFQLPALPCLRRLILKKNRLESIALEGLPSLKTLSLANNRLRSLPSLNFPKLRFVLLRYNLLSALPEVSFSTEFLDLRGNLLQDSPLPVKPNLILATNQTPYDFATNPETPLLPFKPISELLSLLIPLFKQQTLDPIAPPYRNGLAALYSQLINLAPLSDPAYFEHRVSESEITTLFSRLSQEDKHYIHSQFRKPSKHLDRRDLFFAAVHNAILRKYDNRRRHLDQEIITCLRELAAASLSPSEELDPIIPKKNLCRLALAIEMVDHRKYPHFCTLL